MYSPLIGTGRTIQVGDGHKVTVTEAMQQAANYATSDMILDRRHPGDIYRNRMIDSLNALRDELRKQIRLDENDDSTRFNRDRLAFIAKWIGTWDVAKGHAKGNPNIVPVRTVMDIPMMAECAAHGLMHTCKEV